MLPIYSYACSSALVVLGLINKYISRTITDVPRHALLSARFGIAFLLLIPIFLIPKSNKLMITKNLPLQFFRSVSICAVIFFTYIGYESLPLGIAGAISAAEPIFVAIWSLILGFENKKTLPILLLIVGLGVGGMLIMINMTSNLVLDSKNITSILSLILANIICSGSHFLSAILSKQDSIIDEDVENTSTKVAKKYNFLTTMIYNNLFINGIMLAANILLGITGNNFNFSSLQPHKFKLLALGSFAVINSWLGLAALSQIDPNMHVSIQNLSLPLTIIIARFVEGDPISLSTIAGTIAILITVTLLHMRNNKKHRKALFIALCSGYAFVCFAVFYTRFYQPKTHELAHTGPCCG